MADLVTCEHLRAIEAAARAANIGVVATGDWWGNGHHQAIYFDCVLARERIEGSFELSAVVEWNQWDGRATGHEAGFYCKQCNSMLVGGHAVYGGEPWPSE